MTDTSERDRLAELLASFLHAPTSTPYFVAGYIAGPEEIADVLLAAGWSRVVPRPDVEAEVEWGVRTEEGEMVADRLLSESVAREYVALPDERVVSRTVGPWQEAQ